MSAEKTLLTRAAELESALMKLHVRQNGAIAKLAARFEAERTALVESDPEAYAMMTDAHAVGAV